MDLPNQLLSEHDRLKKVIDCLSDQDIKLMLIAGDIDVDSTFDLIKDKFNIHFGALQDKFKNPDTNRDAKYTMALIFTLLAVL